MRILDARSNLRGRRAAIIGGAGAIGKAITMGSGGGAGGRRLLRHRRSGGQNEQSRKSKPHGATLSPRLPLPSMRRNFAESTTGLIDIVVNVVGGVLMQPFMHESHESCDQLSREPTDRRLPPLDRRGKEPHDERPADNRAPGRITFDRQFSMCLR